MNLTDFDGLSCDEYGTHIDSEAGIAAVLGPWARRFDASCTDEQELVAYSVHGAVVEAYQPGLPYPLVLAEAFRRTGVALGSAVRDDEAAFGTRPVRIRSRPSHRNGRFARARSGPRIR